MTEREKIRIVKTGGPMDGAVEEVAVEFGVLPVLPCELLGDRSLRGMYWPTFSGDGELAASDVDGHYVYRWRPGTIEDPPPDLERTYGFWPRVRGPG
jgi:hypothetical protein